jgi:hypothetical protein
VPVELDRLAGLAQALGRVLAVLELFVLADLA